MSQAVEMTEEKALRQRESGKTCLGSGTFHFQLRLSSLRLLTAVLASAEPSRESEARRGRGSGGKERNHFQETQRKGKGEGEQA